MSGFDRVSPHRELICNYFKMSGLHNNQPSGGSKSVKVNQTCCEVRQQQRPVAPWAEAGLPRRSHCREGGSKWIKPIFFATLCPCAFALSFPASEETPWPGVAKAQRGDGSWLLYGPENPT